MRKNIGVLILLIFLSVSAFGDSESLQIFLQDFFEEEDNAVKTDILEKAFSHNDVNDFTELFEFALQYTLHNYVNVNNYYDFNNIILTSLNGLRTTGVINEPDLLWSLFLEYPVSEIKAELMMFLGSLGKENINIIDNINSYLLDSNSLYSSGKSVDYITISASIAALMELDNNFSYPVLLDVLRVGYPEVIASEASGALDSMSGNLNQFLRDIIESGLPEEKFTAFKTGINSERLGVAERGELAELALKLTLDDGGREKDTDFSALCYAAVSFLSSLRWTRANDLAIKYYYNTLSDFQEDINNKNRLIEAISFLGAVGNSEAALALGLQLGLINDRKEKTGFFDAGITLAIIQSLGLIGDSAAFNHLLRARNLSYSESITFAAREAMNRLKW